MFRRALLLVICLSLCSCTRQAVLTNNHPFQTGHVLGAGEVAASIQPFGWNALDGITHDEEEYTGIAIPFVRDVGIGLPFKTDLHYYFGEVDHQGKISSYGYSFSKQFVLTKVFSLSLTYAFDKFETIPYKIAEPSLYESSNHYYEYREDYLDRRHTFITSVCYQYTGPKFKTRIFMPLSLANIQSSTFPDESSTVVFAPGIGIGVEFKYLFLRNAVNYPIPGELKHLDNTISIAPFYAFQVGIKYDFKNLVNLRRRHAYGS